MTNKNKPHRTSAGRLNENGKNAKGFGVTKQFCMCIVLFCIFPCCCCMASKRFSFFFLKKKITNILQIENDGIRGMEFETM